MRFAQLWAVIPACRSSNLRDPICLLIFLGKLPALFFCHSQRCALFAESLVDTRSSARVGPVCALSPVFLRGVYRPSFPPHYLGQKMPKLPSILFYAFYVSRFVSINKITEGFWDESLFLKKASFWDESLNKLRPIHRDVVCLNKFHPISRDVICFFSKRLQLRL